MPLLRSLQGRVTGSSRADSGLSPGEAEAIPRRRENLPKAPSGSPRRDRSSRRPYAASTCSSPTNGESSSSSKRHAPDKESAASVASVPFPRGAPTLGQNGSAGLRGAADLAVPLLYAAQTCSNPTSGDSASPSNGTNRLAPSPARRRRVIRARF